MAAFYRATFAEFLNDTEAEVLGRLLASYQHLELQKRQTKAWEKEIRILKKAFAKLVQSLPTAVGWSILLEYPIPRRAKRLDAVILAADVVFCLEFKTEDKAHGLQSQRQVEEYALDLRDFHEASSSRPIIPVVVVPKALSIEQPMVSLASDTVDTVLLANEEDVSQIIRNAFEVVCDSGRSTIDPKDWDHSAYRPVPTILEAAEALYAGHDVLEIAHSHAGAFNLTTTSDRLLKIIQGAQQSNSKVVCFVTGVPGAGKTLAGLKLVHDPTLRKEGRPSGVFLSGNGPLVKIVSAAIARDYKRRLDRNGGERTVTTFIQNVHSFVREGLEKVEKAPVEKVVVFDEAQRAWDAAQNQKKNGLDVSEPETMISIMDRHKDWAVLVALVGGGQEMANDN